VITLFLWREQGIRVLPSTLCGLTGAAAAMYTIARRAGTRQTLSGR